MTAYSADAVEKLYLYAVNEADLYHQRIVPLRKTLEKKWRKGVFNRMQARHAFMRYFLREACVKHQRDVGASEAWSDAFPVAVRREVADQLVSEFLGELEVGNSFLGD